VTATPAVEPALITDLYELTMAAAYHAQGIEREATFELSVRSLPPARRFMVVGGIEDALAGVQAFRYSADDIAYLATLGSFSPAFLDRLADLRFSGEVWAMPEGEVAYPGEPLVRVTGPLVEAQLLETFLLNVVGSRTMVASKAARVALATGDRRFVDFSARRDHGIDAAMGAARAAWITGGVGTSLVAAGRRWGIPLSGTMAHSFVLSFDDEADAFRAYARSFPESVVLLIDTYDTVRGAQRVVEVAHELASDGITIRAVRLDSGDLRDLSFRVRDVLDAGGLTDVEILASGDLDEHQVAALCAAGAPIDAFGVGTQLGTSADAPALGVIYKLVEDSTGPKMKLATGKVTLPARKQVWRQADRDVVSLHDEPCDGRPLLRRMMAGGRLTGPPDTLAEVRERCMAALAGLPARARSLGPADGPSWPVESSPGLAALTDKVRAALVEPVRGPAAGAGGRSPRPGVGA
jgi:nicotinate phosphoribosyltransferase